MGREVRILSFPGEDRSFQACVEGLIELERRRGRRPDPASVQRTARQRYPACVIRCREGLAELSSGEIVTWYAFRDGSRFTRPSARLGDEAEVGQWFG